MTIVFFCYTFRETTLSAATDINANENCLPFRVRKQDTFTYKLIVFTNKLFCTSYLISFVITLTHFLATRCYQILLSTAKVKERCRVLFVYIKCIIISPRVCVFFEVFYPLAWRTYIINT